MSLMLLMMSSFPIALSVFDQIQRKKRANYNYCHSRVFAQWVGGWEEIIKYIFGGRKKTCMSCFRFLLCLFLICNYLLFINSTISGLITVEI